MKIIIGPKIFVKSVSNFNLINAFIFYLSYFKFIIHKVKRLICPASCKRFGCIDDGESTECCHEDCLAGCNDKSRSDCNACKHFKSLITGECVYSCDYISMKTYGRYCVEECPSK